MIVIQQMHQFIIHVKIINKKIFNINGYQTISLLNNYMKYQYYKANGFHLNGCLILD